jgi:5-methylcytosine-specific restriction endonuclease McrA
VPVVYGGGGCGLDGYQTLCVPCHKKETSRLAACRARDRRRAHFEEMRQGELWP